MAKILIVDGCPNYLKYMSISLSGQEHEVTTLTHGLAAQYLLKAETFDLLIADYGIRPMSGYELLQFGLDHFPTMPVIILGSRGKEGDHERMLDAGACAYLPKPFIVGEFLSVVQAALVEGTERNPRISEKPATRILLVNNEAGFLHRLKRFLSENGYYVKTALNGSEAKSILQAETFDLLLSNNEMPAVNGYELLQFAQEHFPTMLVIMTVKYGSLEECGMCLREGACKYLLLPMFPEVLLSEITDALEYSPSP